MQITSEHMCVCEGVCGCVRMCMPRFIYILNSRTNNQNSLRPVYTTMNIEHSFNNNEWSTWLDIALNSQYHAVAMLAKRWNNEYTKIWREQFETISACAVMSCQSVIIAHLTLYWYSICQDVHFKFHHYN